MELAEELRRLAPFGRGNPGVSLMVEGARFEGSRPMGEGKHMRFTVESGGARARAVAFGSGPSLPVGDGEPARATFSLEVNDWNGVCEPRLVLRRASPVGAAADPPPPAPQGRGSPPPETHELVLFALP
jgi:single-stranded-DNA-specific exonuclease